MIQEVKVEIKESDIKWLDEAREYILEHKRLSKADKLFYIGLLQFSNLSAWRDFIDDGYSPADAVDEDMSYAD